MDTNATDSLVEALRYYANPRAYGTGPHSCFVDDGAVAQAALGLLDGPLHDLSGEVDEMPSMATGETFQAIHKAICDPAQHCKRIPHYPKGTRQIEPLERWQTRAIMAALGKFKSGSEA